MLSRSNPNPLRQSAERAGDGRCAMTRQERWMVGKRDRRAATLGLLAIVLLPFASVAQSASIERQSVDASGTEGNGRSTRPALSASGRWVAFDSEADNLVPGDANGTSDVFVRDRRTGALELVSRSSGGVQGNRGSWAPSMSMDGRYVAFHSAASNLVGGDTNGLHDVFVHDRATGETSIVSVDLPVPLPLEPNEEHEIIGIGSLFPHISADGRLVVFHWLSPRRLAVLLRDRAAGTTTLVSRSLSGAVASSSFLPCPATITANGRWVVFHSSSDRLVIGDTNGAWDVFSFDTGSGAIVRLSLGDGGGEGHGGSFCGSISEDGRFVTYSSYASDLVAGDTNGVVDLFLRDRFTGDVVRPDLAGGVEVDGDTIGESADLDFRRIAIWTEATNVIAGDGNGTSDVLVHELASSVTTPISVDRNGVVGSRGSGAPAISADGRFVAFGSDSPDLVAGDTNGVTDVFMNRTAPAAQDLVLDLAAPATVDHDDLLPLKLEIRNEGSLDVAGVELVVRAPKFFSLLSAGGAAASGCTLPPTTGPLVARCPLPKLASGDVASVSLELSPGDLGPAAITATASPVAGDDFPVNNSAHVVVDVVAAGAGYLEFGAVGGSVLLDLDGKPVLCEGQVAEIEVLRYGRNRGRVTADVVEDVCIASPTGRCVSAADYRLVPSTVELLDGMARTTFKVVAEADGVDEGAEGLWLRLTNATGGAGIGPPGLLPHLERVFLRLSDDSEQCGKE